MAHINTSEANAAGFLGGGLKLVPVAGTHGRIDPATLRDTLAALDPAALHRGKPAGVNITQASDLGAVYPLDDIRAIAEAARAHGLKVHMDGARFANAVARLGVSPAEMSWRAGVDIMSFGATKNGGALCDAIVVFNPELADPLGWNLRRAGQVWSKMRFASAQLMAYVEDGLWLRLARASNAAAARIAAGIEGLPGLRLVAPVEANEIFLELPGPVWTHWNRTAFSSTAGDARWPASSAASTCPTPKPTPSSPPSNATAPRSGGSLRTFGARA